MPIKSALALVAAILGFVGFAGCVAAMVGVLSLGARVSRINDRAFALMESSLGSVRDRILASQIRVQRSKLTADEIEQTVRNWAQSDPRRELGARLQLEEKTQKLAAALQIAGAWLETSEASVRGVQQDLEFGGLLGVPVDAAWADRVIEKLADLSGQLKRSTETVDDLREALAAFFDDKARDDRIERAARIVARLAATLSDVDVRLGETAERLSERRHQLEDLRSRTHRYIVLGCVTVLLALAWLAAGQAALCLGGWRNFRGKPTSKISGATPVPGAARE